MNIIATHADPAMIEAAATTARLAFADRLLDAAGVVNAVLAGRSPREVAAADAVKFLAAMARYQALAAAQNRFAAAVLRRIDRSR